MRTGFLKMRRNRFRVEVPLRFLASSKSLILILMEYARSRERTTMRCKLFV